MRPGFAHRRRSARTATTSKVNETATTLPTAPRAPAGPVGAANTHVYLRRNFVELVTVVKDGQSIRDAI